MQAMEKVWLLHFVNKSINVYTFYEFYFIQHVLNIALKIILVNVSPKQNIFVVRSPNTI